jgi:hypothetical protein
MNGLYLPSFLISGAFLTRIGLLSKHSADAANIQKSNSVNHFNLCATIWKVRICEGTPAIRNSGKKSATDQK